MAIQAKLDLGNGFASDAGYFRIETFSWLKTGGYVQYDVIGYASKGAITVPPPWKRSLLTAAPVDLSAPLLPQIYADLQAKIDATNAAMTKAPADRTRIDVSALAGSSAGISGSTTAI